jgi:hypothetical protein
VEWMWRNEREGGARNGREIRWMKEIWNRRERIEKEKREDRKKC